MKRAFVFVLFIFCFSQIFSQNQNLRFEQITTEQGLSQSTVYDILKDSKGFMWFATLEGLNRYDGYSFKIYYNDPGDSSSISNNQIRDLYEDGSGNLWIGTAGGGLNKYNREKDNFTHFRYNPNDSLSLSSGVVNCISGDAVGNLWVGTSEGLNYFDNVSQTFKGYFHNSENTNSLSNNFIRNICVDEHDNVWVGTSGGLNKYNPKENLFIRYNDNNSIYGIDGHIIYSLFEDNKGDLWIGTNKALNRLHKSSGEIRHYYNVTGSGTNINYVRINGIDADSDGNLWLALNGYGLTKVILKKYSDEVEFFNYHHDPNDSYSMSTDILSKVYCEKNGLIWLGSIQLGINIADPAKSLFGHYYYIHENSNTISANMVCNFIEDNSGILWINTANGLNRFNPVTQTFKHYFASESPNSLSDNFITTSVYDASGVIWIGTIRGGLNKYDISKNIFSRYPTDPNNENHIANEGIMSLYNDTKGKLWIGLNGDGLNILDIKSGKVARYLYNTEDSTSISGNYVYSISEDSAGTVWLGTSSNGLNKAVRSKKENGASTELSFKRYLNTENPKSISSNSISMIFCSSDGSLWIGTNDAGFNKLVKDGPGNTAEFKRYSVKDGLPNNGISAIIEDDNGNLWISTNKGISKFNPVDETFINYDYKDGLQANETVSTSCYKTKDGKILFGGTNGFNMFHPDDIVDRPKDNKPVITDFKLFNKPVSIANEPTDNNSFTIPAQISQLEELILSYQENIFSFEFSALEFASPQKIKYAYNLEGFSDEWIKTDASERSAQFTNLDDGVYVFKIKASDKHGRWNKNHTSLNIVITPPPWKTWWAYSLYFIIISCSVLFVYYRKTKSLRERQEELEKEVTLRTKEVTEERDKSSSLLNSANSGIFGCDPNGNVTFMNPAALSMLGYEETEIVGHKIHPLIHHSYQDGSVYLIEDCPMYKSFNNGEIAKVDDEVLWRKDGTCFDVEYSTTPIKSDNKIIGSVVVFEDITKRKTMEKELKLVQFGIDNARDSICFIDPVSAKILDTNINAYQSLGFKKEEIVGRKFWYFDINFLPENWNGFVDKLKEGDKAYYESVLYTKEDRIIPIEISASFFEFEGENYIVAFTHDITERKKAEENLREAKDIAESATEAKSKFLATMSHEIRNPMNAIIGLTHLALGTKLDEKQKDYVSKAHASSKNLLGIINDILDFSKIEAGKLDIENIPFDLHKVMDDIRDVFIFKTEEKNIGFIIEKNDKVPQYLFGDPLRIGQILTNFVSNAIKFTSKGAVTLNAELINGTNDKVKLKLSVRDTGLGMTPEQVGKMFKSYSQADKSTSRKFGGTGLGLSITKHLAELMKGEVGVESKEGEGSTFYFTSEFDICHDTSQFETDESDLLPTSFSGVTVIVAEDNEINQQVASEVLQSADVKVITADNGKIALDLVKESGVPSKYHLVFMDLQMPDMDGITATKEIRKLKEYYNLPIVAMSADVMEGVREECLEAGMNDFITKPIEPKEVFEMINKWVDLSKVQLEGKNDSNPITKLEYEIEAKEESGIPDIYGIHTEEGLRRVGGNKKLYSALLEKFYNSNTNVVEEIKSALREPDQEKAVRLAHTVKGVAGNLGAIQLNKAAAVVEAELKNKDLENVEELLNEFEKELNPVMKSLAEWIKNKTKEEEVDEGGELDKEKFTSLIEELKVLVEENDFDATRKLEEIMKISGLGEHKNTLQKIFKLVSDYDFDEAMKILIEIKL